MRINAQQGATKIDQFRSIQMQGCNRRASRRRSSADLQKIFTPREMLRPELTARVKQGHHPPCHGITRMSFIVFVTITT